MSAREALPWFLVPHLHLMAAIECSLLARLYGADLADQTVQKLYAVVEKHRAAIAQSFAAHPSHRRSGTLLTESDVIMIAYGDHLVSSSSQPLRTLAAWCKENVSGLITSVHLLPFHPSTSYDGYAITDYMAIDPRLGTWADMAQFEQAGFSLMSDLVLNHCSQSHPWFQQFLRGERPGADYFIHRYAPGTPWLEHVKRARNLPLISSYEGPDGCAHHAWTTYHRDLVDLNWANPDVCVEFVDILLDSVARGFRFIRLDAFAYVWKREGTACVNLPETADLLNVFLQCLRAAGAGDVSILPSITNVTQAENLQYLHAGAALVYHLPLSALLLHTLYSSSAAVLSRWLAAFPQTPPGHHLLNLAASHDGVGLTWCADILTPDEIRFLCDHARARGGIVQTRRATAATAEHNAQPWEINITYFSACAPDAATPAAERLAQHVDRFLATQSVVVALKGVPALYFSLFMAGENDLKAMDAIRSANLDPNAHCIERAINRGRFSLEEWRARMASPDHHPHASVLSRMQRLLRVRTSHAAFHPDAPQQSLHLAAHPALLILRRTPLASPASAAVVCITNFSPSRVIVPPLAALQLLGDVARVGGGHCIDILDEQAGDRNADGAIVDARSGLSLAAYGTVWLAALTKEPSLAATLRFVSASAVHAVPYQPPSSDAPAKILGVLSGPLNHYAAYSADSPEGKTVLAARAGDNNVKVVHFVRHAQSFHKRIADAASLRSGGRDRCFCFEHTLGDAKARARALMTEECAERGAECVCPYLSEAGVDSPLTADGLRTSRAELARVPTSVRRVFAAASTRTLQTAAVIAELLRGAGAAVAVVATDLLRPMLGFHTHAHRSPRAVLAALFPDADLSRLTHEADDARPEAGHWESRLSMDARASAALAEAMACTEREVAVVAHFTTLYAMLMPAADGRIFGPRPGADQRPLLDCSACPALARLVAEPALSEAAVLSLVLVRDALPHAPAIAAPAPHIAPPPLLDQVCAALLLGDAGSKASLTSRNAQVTDDSPTLWHLVLASAAATPNAIAVFGPSAAARLTYGELLMRALRLVRRLQEAGVHAGAYIGVCAERSVACVVAALAVLVSGGTYFGIHPNDPLARRQAVVALTRPAALLCTAATKSIATECGAPTVLCVDNVDADAAPVSAAWVASLRAPALTAVAYCPFTSGSSGPPKAVQLCHRAVTQFLLSQRACELADGAGASALGAATRVLQLSRCSFDISWIELIAPLALGGATVLLPPDIDTSFSVDAVVAAVATHAVTWTFMVPAVARLLADHLAAPGAARLASLRTLCVGGEQVPLSLARDLQALLPSCRIVQAYGPAECSVYTTNHRLRPSDVDSFPIGAPLPGYRVTLIDDETGKEVSRGEIGTMYISGHAIMDGYLRNEEASKAALRDITIDGQRVRAYCSGDLARQDIHGALHYIGRRDRQVKLHGQRLELAGVEAVAATFAAVRAVAVKKWSAPPDRQFLCAYVAWTRDALRQHSAAALEAELRAELGRHLLAWMVPAVIVTLDGDLPRNAHGKVDLGALKMPLAPTHATPRRVCIVGGGVAGLLVAIEALRRGMQVTLVERAADFGGVWGNGAASAHSKLQQPAEYYAVDGLLPLRFPDAPTVHAYLADVAQRHSLAACAVFCAEVTDVAPAEASRLSVTWRKDGATRTDAFDLVVCATGRFDPTRLVRPAWQPAANSARSVPAFVPAARLDPAACAAKRVVIVGGGPYAVEAVRLCVGGGAAQVSVVIRRPHWVFPRSWFASRALTRLFWRLCSGSGLSRRMVLLCKIAVARHYLRAGIGHLIPTIALTDPKTSISDEFFDHARLLHVRYLRGDVDAAPSESGLIVRTQGGLTPLPCDIVVVACGFERPSYPYLHRFAPLELYLGSWAIAQPNLCFVGVGLGDGVFPNPHTMRPQVDVILNHAQHPECARTDAEMRAWLHSAAAGEGEVAGAAAHLSEHLAELQHQRRALARRPRSAPRSAPLQGDGGDVAVAVLHAAQGAGLSLSMQNVDDPLVTLGMDSLGAVRFRALLAARFPHHALPNIGSLLWDFPTLGHVVRHFSAAPSPAIAPTACVATVAPSLDQVEDVPPLLTREEAEAYVLRELGLSSGVLATLRSDPVAFITAVCEQFHRTVPFQSFTLLHVERACRRLPSLAQLRSDVYARIGGCCYVLNVFMRELLRAFGFSTYFARCAIHGVEDCHMTVVLRGLSTAAPSADLWLVDVGCGYVTARPMHVTWGPEPESPVYEYGFLRLKWVRTIDEASGEPILLRLHSAASTFDRRELNLIGKRTDEFTHLFWKMSLRPRPMHDSGETQQVRAFVGYQKLRASIGWGPQCRMVYFKGDNDRGRLVASVQEDVDGTLRGTPLSADELLARLVQCFPAFTRDSLAAAIQRVISSAQS